MGEVFIFYPVGKDSNCRAVKKCGIIVILKGENMNYYLGKIAMMLVKTGFEVKFCMSEHVVYAGDGISIRYIEEHDVFLIEKKDDADIFEVDTPVEEIIDWVR